ncbi:hypothetical protein J2T12_002000 [Paenibacillus anaericanus]|uniref:hypothetical protein n=1 Tax=Paenibacillus anaericanus TaxID=170367 RepID=UPI0027823BE0|nr:hypothetical protein [Paenibacillus anaericanus]MDQ0088594.1 hypothetical protein [Paenibacillus anaericanus]
MCKSCFVLRELFTAAISDAHQNYIPTISFIKEMIKQQRLELYAGDCPLEEVARHLSEEIHYTVRHYLRCKSCNHYFFIGACIRGTPIYKTIESINDVNVKNMWGNYGSLYETKRST